MPEVYSSHERAKGLEEREREGWSQICGDNHVLLGNYCIFHCPARPSDQSALIGQSVGIWRVVAGKIYARASDFPK